MTINEEQRAAVIAFTSETEERAHRVFKGNAHAAVAALCGCAVGLAALVGIERWVVEQVMTLALDRAYGKKS